MMTIPEGTSLIVDRKKFETGSFIGEGNIGTVWKIKAIDGTAHVLKILEKFPSQSFAQNFLIRMEVFHKIDYLHITPIEHFGLLPVENQSPSLNAGKWQPIKKGIDGIPFFIMPYAEKNLGHYLSSKERNPATDITYAIQLCLGLQRVHTFYVQGVKGNLERFFHGNLKPSNLLLFKHGKSRYTLKIADLGLDAGDRYTTHPYLTPEQRQNNLSFHSDLWCLKMLLQELMPTPPEEIKTLVAGIKGDGSAHADTLPSLVKALWIAQRTLQKKELARSVYMLGLNLFENGHYKYALDDFEKALSLDPQFIESLIYKAECFKQLNRYEEALQSLQEALQINPQNAIIYENRGEIYLDQKSYPQAIADFEKALELDTSASSAHGSLSMVYSAMGEYEKALTHLDKVIEISPEFAIAYMDKGDILMRLASYDLAIRSYEKALELNKSDSPSINPDEVRNKIAEAQKNKAN